MARPKKVWIAASVIVVLIGAGAVGLPLARNWWVTHHQPERPVIGEEPKSHATLVAHTKNAIELPPEVVATLGLKTVDVVKSPPPEPLRLDGSLFLDANRMVHVHTRFAGEVVELGELESTAPTVGGVAGDEWHLSRPVRFGDDIKKGQLLAVIWSKDLGEKKSELVENLSRLRLDQEKLERLQELLAKGSVPERSVKEAERVVESDLIAVSRVERTLRSWRLSEPEIETIRQEAERVHSHKGQWGKELEGSWARVEVRAPIGATIVEKNVAVGDFVTTDMDMFKIADLSRMDVLAHVYEEDLPELERLPRNKRHWTIHLRTDPDARPLEGSFEQIGNIIDPNQHTALVMGWVDNHSGRLRIGQFVTANINLPAATGEVAVPNSAVVDEDGKTLIFVQTDPHQTRYTRRRVLVVRRHDDLAYVSSAPPADQKDVEGLSIGEKVVSVGGVELAAELESLLAASSVATVAEKSRPDAPAVGAPEADSSAAHPAKQAAHPE